MKIVIDYPPNIEDIKKVFTLQKGTAFTYGDVLYNPDDGEIDLPLMTHEETHSKQQGKKVKEWWTRYLLDSDFRFAQELEAYQAQYKHFCRLVKDRNKQAKFLYWIASTLASAMYGSLCSTTEAMNAIKSNVKFKIEWN